MRRLLFALVLAGFSLGCEAATTPFSPDDTGSLQPAEECEQHETSPC